MITTSKQLVVNRLSKTKYQQLVNAGKVYNDELYLISETVPLEDSLSVNIDGVSRSDLSSVFTGITSTAAQKYAVYLDNNKCYVNVPWIDSAISSAYYDQPTKKLVLVFNKTTIAPISVDISDLVDTYTAGTGLKLVGNQFSVSANYALLASTLAGYGITDAYTKTETNSAIATALSDYHPTKLWNSTSSEYLTEDGVSHTATGSVVDRFALSSSIGANSGIASLDAGGKVPVTQLPDLGSGIIIDEYGTSAEAGELVIKKLTLAEYEDLVAKENTVSNYIYVVSADVVNAYGQRYVNLGEPELSADAVTKHYADLISSAIPLSVSQLINDKNYISGISDEYKTYVETLSALSADGYATSAYVKSQLSSLNAVSSVNGFTGNVIVQHTYSSDLKEAADGAGNVYDVTLVKGGTWTAVNTQTNQILATMVWDNTYNNSDGFCYRWYSNGYSLAYFPDSSSDSVRFNYNIGSWATVPKVDGYTPNPLVGDTVYSVKYGNVTLTHYPQTSAPSTTVKATFLRSTNVVNSIGLSSTNSHIPSAKAVVSAIPLSASQLKNDCNFISSIPASYKTYSDTTTALSSAGYVLSSMLPTIIPQYSTKTTLKIWSDED